LAWSQLASIRGPQGIEGPTGAQGIQGVQGPAGVDGASVRIAGQVATYVDLPTGLGTSDTGSGYLVDADGLLYLWSGPGFPAPGAGVDIRGPAGPTGPQGATGPTGATGSTGATGATGASGATGARGATWFTGSGSPGSITGAQVDDLYLDTATGDVYVLGA